jgi:hypothetical protein
MGGNTGQDMDGTDVTINSGTTNVANPPSATTTKTSTDSTYSVRGGGPVVDDETEITTEA